MKADMRAPTVLGGEYLLMLEAETALEQGALAHFARFEPTPGTQAHTPKAKADEDMRVLFAIPQRDPRFVGAPAVSAVFIGWEKRETMEPKAHG